MTGAFQRNEKPGGSITGTRPGLDLRSLWAPAYTCLCLLLFLPYTTGAMHWFYGHGYMPVQPVYYMLMFGAAVAALGMIKRPEFATISLLVLGLVGGRAIDATFLQRFIYPGDQKSFMSFLISVVFMALVSAVAVGVMRRGSKAPVMAVAFATVLVCSLVNLYEFLGFGHYSTVEGRAAGFIEDANNSAIAITLMLGVCLSCSRRFWWNAFLVGIAGAGVLVTLSRSGMLVYCLMVLVWVGMNLRANFGRMVIITAIGVPLASIGVGAMIAYSMKSAGVRGDANVEGRLAALFGGDVEKMASNERSRDLLDGLEGVGKAPVAGMGTGAGTAFYRPHNQLISVWLDLGLAGLLSYGLLLLLLGWKCLATGFVGVQCLIPVVCYVPFSQALLETPTYWLAVLVLITITTSKFWSFSIFGRRVASDRVKFVPIAGMGTSGAGGGMGR